MSDQPNPSDKNLGPSYNSKGLVKVTMSMTEESLLVIDWLAAARGNVSRAEAISLAFQDEKYFMDIVNQGGRIFVDVPKPSRGPRKQREIREVIISCCK